MTPVVLDTNVLVVGFVSRESVPGQIIHAWHTGLYRLIVSEHIIHELSNTFQDTYFRRRLSENQIARAIALLREEAIATPLTVELTGVATHPEDDLILGTAVSGKAKYLVTGDKQLQKLGSYQGVAILSPAEFLKTLTVPSH